ncbi:MAG: hypothetical protein A3F13_09430 [Gammaproteobacteria bacterium RIFCSPHIGHO2_12_FULL_40_19]|nr:MAG: hypothetical protein A3F13_09430 [Gammaproteobacteria bacterium RIFCSPHIGHO2_12_FULL_40_19]
MSKIINADSQFLNANAKIESIPDFVLSRNVEWPLCSVVIPSYNYGDYLRETIDSILAQTFSSLEVVIVDDGSTDLYTREVVQSYIGIPRVQVLLKNNGGLAAARNSGIAIARGKYICCLDSDDLLAPSYIEQCIFELESHENVGFVYSWVQLFGDESFVWETRDFNIDVAKKENLTSVCAVYRKSDWMLVGGYGPKILGGLEDWEFWLRLSQLGRCGKAIPVPLFLYRKHGKTMWDETAAKREKLMDHIRDRNPGLYTNKRFLKKLTKYISKPSAHYFPSRLAKVIAEDRGNKQKKTLLVVLPWLQLGGAEILMLDILKGLSQEYDFTIVTTLSDTHGLYEGFRQITNTIFHYPGKYNDAKDAIQFSLFLRYLIESRQVDTILGSGTWHFYESLRDIKSHYPSIHIFDLLHNNASGHFISSVKYDAFIERHICVSDKVKESLVENRVCEDKITAICNGIDNKHIFYPRPDVRDQLKAEFDIPLNRPVVGFVGRASEEKRPFLFLELISKLSETQDVFSVFLGKGPLLTEVKNKIIELGLSERMICMDAMPREALWKVYEVCDVLVNVSAIEGMPLTALEAFATGCPVAAMQVGHLEAVIKDGENGILVAKDDFDTLIHKLSTLLRNTQQLSVMRDNAVKYFSESSYTLEKMVSQYKKILQGEFSEVI